ncbi:MAG: DUF1569 domain-containing protein [Gammaproteobacteria bacterium]|nr:DUF1569 domain-containing protein [Gammaproteobacteria bacterium]
MNRRRFLIGSSVGIASLAAAGFTWTQLSNASQPLTIDSALELLDSIDLSKAKSTTTWSLSQVFIHCAQSVECSIKGFPEHKSALFQETVGSLAFSLFKASGSMTHNTTEEIPALISFQPNISLKPAIDYLKTQLIAFKHYNGKLQPHFAYGDLNKREYEIAHVLHLLDHCSEIEFES